jgi:broad specificity phosphatase PhoE
MALTILLTRHGKTPRSEPEQHLGQRVDIELSANGRHAAERLRERLRDVPIDRVVSSSLRRAMETASTVAGDRVEVEPDPRLMEMDYGEWEGLTYEQIDERDRDRRRAWVLDPETLATPGGESGADVARRVRGVLADLVSWAGDDDRTALLVAHSTTNRVLLAVALGVPLRMYRERFRQAQANLSVLRFPATLEDGAMLLLANDVSHLKGTSGITWD